jgi:ComF family protein
MVYKWLDYIRSRILSPRCRLCLAPGETGLELCRPCRGELPRLLHGCQRCGLPLPDGARTVLCAACLRAPPALDGCFALFGYQPPIDQWIHSLKFGRDLAAARLLGELLLAELAAGGLPTVGAPVLLPVPLHTRRLRQRGYNQSLEIARPLIRNGLRLSGCRCQRNRHTAAQSSLPARHRQRNIRGAFSVRGRLEDPHILLIDDVMTTGATLNELARTLKAAGATRVDACVIARAAKQGHYAPGTAATPQQLRV